MQKLPCPQQQLLSLSPGLITAVVFFASGICWTEPIILRNHFLLYVIFLLFFLIFIFYKFKAEWHCFIFYSLLCLLFFLIGHHHVQPHLTPPANPHHIFNQITEQQTASLYGVLAEHPAVVNSPSGAKTRLLMQVKSFHQASTLKHETKKHKKISGLILLM
jgi:hypothetical protein